MSKILTNALHPDEAQHDEVGIDKRASAWYNKVTKSKGDNNNETHYQRTV